MGRVKNDGFPATSTAESIETQSSFFPPGFTPPINPDWGVLDPESALSGLIIDSGVPNLGHRIHLLDIGGGLSSQHQVGIGIWTGQAPTSARTDYTIDTASTSDNRAFLTGVVYRDGNGNNKYDIGEGLGGVTITVAGVGAVTTWSTGGYSIQLNPGTYNVTASGGTLPGPTTRTVTIGGSNVRLNIKPSPTMAQIAGRITNSYEANALFVGNMYQHYLGRPADPGGQNYWANLMTAQGMTQEQVIENLTLSQEWLTKYSSDIVQNLFWQNLGRVADSNSVTYWQNQIDAGLLPQVVAGITTSDEAEGIRIHYDYLYYLGRSESPGDINYWVSRFHQGTSNQDIVAAMLATPEYFNNKPKSNPYWWVGNVYIDVLHRAATNADEIYWVGQLNS
jgi:hypothetical protein